MPGPLWIVVGLLTGAWGVAWVVATYPFETWTVVGLLATVGGLAVWLAGRRRHERPASTRPEVETPSMEALPLAVFISTREVYAPRLAWEHWLIGGASGFGKSNALNAVMVHLSQMPDVQVYASDPKRGVEFQPWRQRLAGLAKTHDENLAMLRFLRAEVEHRLDTLRDRELARKIGHGMGFPWLVLIIDEANEILHIDPNRARKAEVLELLESLISMGRAAGLSVILCTQRPSAQSVPTGIRDIALGRIAFRSTTPEMGDMILGGAGTTSKIGSLKFLPHGVAVVWDDFTETYQRVKFPLVGDDTIRYWADRTAHLATPAAIPPTRISTQPTPSPRRRRRAKPTRTHR